MKKNQANRRERAAVGCMLQNIPAVDEEKKNVDWTFQIKQDREVTAKSQEMDRTTGMGGKKMP